MPTSLAGKASSGGRGPGARGRGLPAAAGMTLMEMMVVVAIIGLIAGISVPSVSAGIDSVRMASASNSVAAFLNSAVNRAERHQLPIEVVISTKENSLASYSNEPGYSRELKLPDGIRIEDAEEVRRLMLMPGGTAPAIGIQLVNRHGSRRMVKLDPMTGFPQVEAVKAE